MGPRTQISGDDDRALAGWLVVLRSTHLTPYSDMPLYVGRNHIGRDTWPEPLNDMMVSGQHLIINVSADQAMLTDISRHGTAVNNRAVQTHVLQDGDMIKIGKSMMVYLPFHEPKG